ncbi:MAG: hypothetical protein AABZ47_06770 [Planctomycetota bacterium]
MEAFSLFLESSGLVGHTIRCGKESLHCNVENDTAEKFRSALVADPWNFSQEQADHIDHERASYLTFGFSDAPRLGKEPLRGVVYLDAKGKRPLFTDEILARIYAEQREVIVDLIIDRFGK